jgi:hypothetical protein
VNPDFDPLDFSLPEEPAVGDGDDMSSSSEGKSDPEDQNDVEEPGVDELLDAAIDHEAQQRLWLRAIIPLLELRSHDTDPSARVQFADDMMHIAACERVARLMRGDLPTSGT